MMNRNHVIFARSLVIAAVFISAHALAAAPNPMCASEGSYIGTMTGLKPIFRINLICMTKDQVAVTISNPPPALEFLSETMTFELQDGDNLVVANFPIGAGDRPTVSANTSLTYVKISMPALRGGHLTGLFMTDKLQKPLELNAIRKQSFTSVGPPCLPLDRNTFVGLYAVNGTPYKLYADVIDDAPVFNLTQASAVAIHLVNAAKMDGSSAFVASTPFGNGEPQEAGFVQIRGCSTSPQQLTLTMIDARHGLTGPFTAVRLSTKAAGRPAHR